MDEAEFKQVAYEVMEVVFAVHNEMGPLFDEEVYEAAMTQVGFEVSFDSFRKRYYLDLLVREGCIFELKAVEELCDRHRAQLLNYLLLLEIAHGKLVNLRGDLVQHEFLNAPLTWQDRTAFQVVDTYWRGAVAPDLRDLLVPILREWGTGLDVQLYEEAVVHFLGGASRVASRIEVLANGVVIGHQTLNLLAPGVAVCLTALNRDEDRYAAQLRRFLRFVPLQTIQWVNIGRKQVSFRTLQA